MFVSLLLVLIIWFCEGMCLLLVIFLYFGLVFMCMVCLCIGGLLYFMMLEVMFLVVVVVVGMENVKSRVVMIVKVKKL